LGQWPFYERFDIQLENFQQGNATIGALATSFGKAVWTFLQVRLSAKYFFIAHGLMDGN
jgi:hypothetical protein